MSSYFSFPNDINLLEKIQGHPNDSRDLEIFSPPEKNDVTKTLKRGHECEVYKSATWRSLGPTGTPRGSPETKNTGVSFKYYVLWQLEGVGWYKVPFQIVGCIFSSWVFFP